MSAPAVGIDLGTTYSCVAVFRKGKVEIIENEQGNRITPSYVAFTDTERLIGDVAKNQEAVNPTNTVFDVKRLIGRRYDEPVVQADMKQWPFAVVSEDGRPKVRVQFKGQQKSFFPEEISAMVLTGLKKSAEVHLGSTVRNAVVTVPAYFNDSQRQATKDAGTIAGLNVLRIINEPTAAALAYGLGEERDDDEEHILVIYDLGGGTFDVSVLSIEEGIFEVRSTAGDTHLGGEDFDTRLLDYCAQEFTRKHRIDLGGDKRALRRLCTACEKAKRTLSSASQVSIDLDALANGQDFSIVVTRSKFEDLNRDLFDKTLEPLRRALSDAGLDKQQVAEVVLVGGSTRIPYVQRLVREFFDKEPNKSVNPDEVVAAGAAVQAAVLDGDPSSTISDLVLVDVTPLSLGIELFSGAMSVILPRNTTIPVTKTRKDYYTVHSNQTNVAINIFEGERQMAEDNHKLGEFTLSGLPKLPAGKANVEVTMHIDADGILQVTAVDPVNKGSNKISVTTNKGRLAKEEVERMVREAEAMRLEDEQRRAAGEARAELERWCYQLQRTARQKGGSAMRPLLDRCSETLTWLASGDASAAACQKRRQELQLIADMLHLNL